MRFILWCEIYYFENETVIKNGGLLQMRQTDYIPYGKAEYYTWKAEYYNAKSRASGSIA